LFGEASLGLEHLQLRNTQRRPVVGLVSGVDANTLAG
jgi:hypothetical protein